MNQVNHELPAGSYLHGKYRIDRVLGQGGFGITYLATQVNLGSRVCIKELYLSGMCTRGTNYSVQSQNMRDLGFDDFKTRFMNEARELARFNHPNIVRVTDVFEENNTAYYVMDYVEGETLKQMVARKGSLNPQEAKPLIAQLLDAVQAVHDSGMLHRDLKPDNILVTPQGRLVLIDFGSARAFGDGHTMTQTAILTPGYAPLEQYSEKARRGPFTDIYSLGGTLYFMFTGQKPIPATDRSFEALPSPDTLNPAVSKPLASVILLAMNLKPEDRFQSISDFRQALLGENKGASAPQQESTVRVERPAARTKSPDATKASPEMAARRRRNGIIAVSVMVGLIAILIIGVAIESSGRRSNSGNYLSDTSQSMMDSFPAAMDTLAAAYPGDSASPGVLPGQDVNAEKPPVDDVYSGGGNVESYKIRMENKCHYDVDFCIAFYDDDNGGWHSRGWFPIKAGATWEYTINSSVNRLYWFAENSAKNLTWSGSDKSFCIRRPDRFELYSADDLDCSTSVSFHALELNHGYSTYHSLSCPDN